jgi:hypothetical protein
MSLMPEFVIQQVLERGFNRFRERNDLVDMLFRNRQVEDVNAFREFIRNETIDIGLNWPDAKIKVPSIIVSLKSEAESAAFLGNLVQGPTNVDSTGTPFRKEELTAPATTLGGGSVGSVGRREDVLAGPFTATAGTTNTVTLPSGLEARNGDALNRPDPFEPPIESDGVILVIREGTGSGQRRVVQSVTTNEESGALTVTVTSNFATTPDATSIVEFVIEAHGRDDFVTGEPAKLFSPDEVVERLGQQYKVGYQLLIVGPDQELTIFLYTLVKAIFIINLPALLRHGFINPKMSGTDFAAPPEYFPDLSYVRAMILEFDYTFDVYLTAEAISQIQIALDVYHPDVGDGSGVAREVSLTLTDILS